MIGLFAAFGVLLVVVGLSRSSGTSSTSSGPATIPTTIPGMESIPGGSVDYSIDIDSALAGSPAQQGRPANGQLVEIVPVGVQIIHVQVMTVTTIVWPDGSGRVAAKVTPSTLKTLIAQKVPGFEAIPTSQQNAGLFVQFDSSKVWALGGMATSS